MRQALVISVPLALSIAACAVEVPESIYFPTYADQGGGPEALIEGLLLEENGCLSIENEATGERSLVLWPEAARISEENGSMVVRQGGFRAEVGQPVAAGGGEYSESEQGDFVRELIGEDIPPRCQSETYWLAHDAYTPEE